MSGGSYEYLYMWADDPAELISRKRHLKAMAERLSGLPYARDAAIETERILAMIERLEIQLEVRAQALADVWHAVEWWDSCDGGEDDVKEALATYRGDKPSAGDEARQWRINPETHCLEPADGGAAGALTGQQWAAQQWPDCPVCGQQVQPQQLNVQQAGDRFPVFMVGAWRCPNDCDPREALARRERP